MAQPQAPWPIDTPVPAAAPAVTLLAAARTPQLPASARWEAGGIAYMPEACADHGVIDPCSNASFGSSNPSNLGQITNLPFVVWAADECSTFGFASRDWAGRATRQLLAATPWEVEHEFWTGTVSAAASLGNQHLASGVAVTDITPMAGAVSVKDGIGCLEQALGQTGYGAQGMIHVTRKCLPGLADAHLVRRQGNLLLTDVDTVVVPGVGYPGTKPDGTATTEGEHYIYATDYVSVFLGDPIPVMAGEGGLSTQYGVLDPSVNTLRYRAERLAVVAFDGCRLFGIRVQVPTCGGSI